jgi:hypothetical protein
LATQAKTKRKTKVLKKPAICNCGSHFFIQKVKNMAPRTLYRIGVVALAMASAFLLCSCQARQPKDKAEYLADFSALAQDAAARCGQLSPSEVQRLNQAYLRYSRDWYERFYPELSGYEKLLVWSLRAQYLSCRFTREAHQTGKSVFQRVEEALTSGQAKRKPKDTLFPNLKN